MKPEVALVLDVDGVVSPVKGHTAWGDDVIAGSVLGDPAHVSPAMCQRLDELGELPGVTPAWLTSWTPVMRAAMNPFAGATWPQIEPVDPPEDIDDPSTVEEGLAAWWKWHSLLVWLDHHPHLTCLVWCDDDLHRTHFAGDELDEPHPDLRRATSAALASRGIGALLIAPTTTAGLAPDDLTRIGQHLHGQ